MIVQAARRYGRGYPGGSRALSAYLYKHVEEWGGSDPFSGVDPLRVVDRSIQDMFGASLANEREQAMHAMREPDEPAT
jgi:hypothetical protein